MAKRKRRRPASARARAGSPTSRRTAARPGANASGTTPSRTRRGPVVRAGVLLVAGALAWLLLFRSRGPGEIPPAVRDAAAAAGCAPLERPVVEEPSREHLAPGDPFTYADLPPAAGPHDPSPLPADPHVYDRPVSETRLVHNLEHAYVAIRFRPIPEGGPSPEAIARLETLAREQDRVIMAPSPLLPGGTGLALIAWNARWLCPATVDPDRAVAIASAFIDAYRGTTNAPEAPRGLLGPILSP